MILIKLGGSVITDKREYRRFNEEAVARLCGEIAEAGKQAVIVHGAGSFGHVLAKRHRLNDGYIDESQIPAVAQVAYDVRELSSMVVAQLMKAGIPAVSMPPGSCMVMEDRSLDMDRQEVVSRFLDKGIVPVMFGDVLMDRKLGFAILSGDQIMERLTEFINFEKVIFVSDIDGLFDCDPKRNKDAAMYDVVTAETLESIDAESSVDDVTGGVAEKMRWMLEMSRGDRECILINGTVPGRLKAAILGEDTVCTKALGGI